MKKLNIILLALLLNFNLVYSGYTYSLDPKMKLTIFLGKIRKFREVISGKEFLEYQVNKNNADYTYVTFSIDNKTYKPGTFPVSIFFDKKHITFIIEI